MTQGYRDDIKGTILHMKDLVDYQEGSIASRMIVNRKAGSITVFAFDEHEGLSEHTAPFDAVVTILDGACEVGISGVPYPLKEGDTIIFPANAPHAVSAVTRFKMVLTMIKD